MGWSKDPRETNNGALDYFDDAADAHEWIMKTFRSYEAYVKSLQRTTKMVETDKG